MTVETFEQVLTLAQADGGLNPAFKKFLQTKFFVPVTRSDNPAQRFALHVDSSGLVISEVADRLGRQHGGSTMSLSGADIVRHLRHDADILVALSDRAFTIARDRVEWLRKAIEAAHAKAAAAKAPAATPAPAPPAPPASAPLPIIDADPISAAWSQIAPATAARPAPPVQTAKPAAAAAAPSIPADAPVLAKTPPAPAAPAPLAPVNVAKAPGPAAPPVRRGGVLDVSTLRPRPIARANIGLSLFIPGEWTDKHDKRALFVTDPLGKTTIEIAGHHRPDMSLSLWNSIRLSQVNQEMSFLQQSGESYPIDYPESRGRIKGMATEYTGVFPGAESEGRYLMACIWTEGTVVSIGIRAPVEEFEDKRSIYNWLLGRVEIAQQASAAVTSTAAGRANVYDAPQSDLSSPELDEEYCEVNMFGVTTEGRIGRLRSIAWCIGLVIPAVIMGWILGRTGEGMTQNVFAVILSLYCLWFSVRVSVLRMHDINRSGKILLAVMGFLVLLAVTKATTMFTISMVVTTLAYFALFYILPGTQGENDYGPPPPPNTTLVKVGAWLVIGLQVLAFILPFFLLGAANVFGRFAG